ncbi:SDR family oxidoreductase [Anaerolineae bacterium CFX9]|nr:SDR family oxidoreductase [Anaerolineae bacterium CFX9]
MRNQCTDQPPKCRSSSGKRPMSDPFAGQPFLVTGAASGIGLAVARHLARRGARLALWDRDADGLEAAARELQPVITRAGDVSLADVVVRNMQHTLESLGGLRGVIHSAGILRTGRFMELPLSAHHDLIHVNLIGTVNVAYAALPALRASGGSLIMLGSVSGLYGGPEYATYGATKAAINNLAQALRIELEADGVHVGVANPLFVDSPMFHQPRQPRLARVKSPLTKIYSTAAVAEAVLDGIEARRPLIWVGGRSRLIYLLSRYGAFAAHSLMRRSWRSAEDEPLG